MPTKSKIAAPSIAMPKGGGALRGMGETFSPQSFSGSAGFSVPLPVAGARGFEPSLALGYSSAAGNGFFGLGFHLPLSSICRKTRTSLPRYDDTDAFESDAGELVRMLDHAQQPVQALMQWKGKSYLVSRYRPRMEGSYAEIQHWVDQEDGGSFWRIRSSADHVETYGSTAASRIYDPSDPSRIFQWLIDEAQDDHGNVIRYHYQAENADNIPDTIFEAGRDHSSQRYPILIEYGNYFYTAAEEQKVNFSFQLVFDFGQISLEDPAADSGTWSARPDPFSEYRPGFEVRTSRLCRRVLLYHQFHDKNGGQRFLTHSLEFQYGLTAAGFSQMQGLRETGHRLQSDGQYWSQAVPDLQLGYTAFDPETSLWQTLEVQGGEMLAGELGKNGFLPIDLKGEGLPGMLYAHDNATLYFAPMGEGRYAPATTDLHFPQDRELGDAALSLASVNGNGRKDLIVNGNGRNGYYPTDGNGRFQAWRNFDQMPVEISHQAHTVVDLTGQGLGDLVIFEQPYLRYYPSEGARGYGQAHLQELAPDFPAYTANYREEVVDFMDILGDGMQHRVRIRAGSVEVWPNLGYGKFGARIQLGNAPQYGGTLDVSRLHFADIDGSGTLDFVYLFPDRIEIYFNLVGNQFSTATVMPLPRFYDEQCQVNFMDVRGNGTTCMVLSKTHPTVAHYFLDFCRENKPYLLDRVENGMGLRTQLQYSSTVQQYLQDKRNGRPWATQLFFPVHVVTQIETREYFNRSRYVQRFAYHDGYYDPVEREFRGFGFAESWDTEHYEKFSQAEGLPGWDVEFVDKDLHVWPSYSKTWYHTGAFEQEALILKQYHREFWQGDAQAFPHLQSSLAPEMIAVDGDTYREAFVALAGQMLRSELYGLDRSALEGNPYTVSESASHVRMVQAKGPNRHAVFQVDPAQSFSYTYDRNPGDPLIAHALSLVIDEYGHDLLSASVAYPRRDQADAVVYPEQQVWQIAVSQNSYINVLLNDLPDPAEDCRLIGLSWEEKGFQLNGVVPSNGKYFTVDDLRMQVNAAMQDQIPYHQPFASGNPPQACLQSWERTYYWNAEQSAVEAGGVAHKRALVHHSETAELAEDQANDLYASKFPNGNLDEVLNQEAGYFLDEGYWWNRGLIQYYATDPAQFYMPIQTDNGFPDVPSGSSLEHLSTVAYDPYWLMPTSTTVVLDGGISLVTHIVNDYIAMTPVQSTDPNGLVSQVLLDPLGQAIASTVYGTEGDKPVGDLDLSEYVVQLAATKADVIADPAKYLQGASSYFYYDFFAYADEKQPPCAVSVTRQTHVHALPAGVTAPMQVAVAYSDSLGRVLVSKAKEGKLWRATGGTVYDNKNQPCEQYLPYQSETSDFIPREQFRQGKPLVPPTVIRYDPLGRVMRTDSPKGYFSRNVYSPWMQQTWDQNDTVKESPFYLANINNTDPSFANNLDALQKAAVHYGTPSTVIHDNLGHTIRSIASNLGQVDPSDLEAMAATIGETGSDVFAALVTAGYLSASGWILPRFQPYLAGFSLDLPAPYAQLDAQLSAYLMQSCLTSYAYNDFQGRPLYTMDARLYATYIQKEQEFYPNFQWTYAMEGNALLTMSADAGEYLALDNIYGGLCYGWDARSITTRVTYDRLQRPISKHVQGSDASSSLSLDQIVEFTVYGEHVADAAKWNLHGKVYKHYGEEGMISYPAYSIYGGPSHVEQRIRPEYKTEVAWNTASMQAMEKERPWQMTFAYNAQGKVTENGLPDGSIVQCGYDEAGVQRTLSRMPKGGKMEPHILDIQYDANSSRTLLRYANGVQTRYTYEDTTLQLLNVRSTRKEQDAGDGKTDLKVLQDLSYSYDPSGNITRKEDTALTQFFSFQSPASPLSDYTYDPLYQLIAATGPLHTGHQPQAAITAAQQREGSYIPLKEATPRGSNLLQQYTQQYQYDNAGNLLQLSHATQGAGKWLRKYKMAANSNRLSNLGKQSFSYDDGGNALAPFGPFGNMLWDFRNYIHQVQVLPRDGQDPDAEYYVYDSAGARVRKVWERMQQGGKRWEIEEKRYFNNYEEKRILHRTASGEEVILLRKTVRLMDGGSAFATIDTWEVDTLGREVKKAGKTLTRYTLADAQGSANLELGDAGELRSYEGYLPYGSIAFRAADKDLELWTQDYGYSGKERDSATGLIYYGFRYYPPWLCRWMNPDPGGTVDGLNLYAFCGGNPATGVDVDGRVGDKSGKKLVEFQSFSDLASIFGSNKKGSKSGIDPPIKKKRKTKEKTRRAVPANITEAKTARKKAKEVLEIFSLLDTKKRDKRLKAAFSSIRGRITQEKLDFIERKAIKEANRSKMDVDQFKVPPAAGESLPTHVTMIRGKKLMDHRTSYVERVFNVSKSSLSTEGRDGTSSTMGKATKVGSNLPASKYSGRKAGIGEAWCHLIAHMLGGLEEVTNLVAGSQGSNLVQKGIEDAVHKFVSEHKDPNIAMTIRVGADVLVRQSKKNPKGVISHMAESFHFGVYDLEGNQVFYQKFSATLPNAAGIQSDMKEAALNAFSGHTWKIAS